MTIRSKSLASLGPLVLLALFAAGGVAGRALALPLPASLVGLGAVLLGLRIGAMAAAFDEPPAGLARPVVPGAGARIAMPRPR